MKSACNPTEGDRDTYSHSQDEFMDFIMRTYRELYRLESRQLCSKSSISVFCRFDIGIIWDRHNIQYFVNEVEHTQTASLWTNPLNLGAALRSRIGLFDSTFANTLYKGFRKHQTHVFCNVLYSVRECSHTFLFLFLVTPYHPWYNSSTFTMLTPDSRCQDGRHGPTEEDTNLCYANAL
jgi:hypothetical protein